MTHSQDQPTEPFHLRALTLGALAILCTAPALEAQWVGPTVHPKTSPVVQSADLSALTPPPRISGLTRAVPRSRGHLHRSEGHVSSPDPVVQSESSTGTPLRGTLTVDLDAPGISFTGSMPADPVGAVGPNHYIQMVNASFVIFDKSLSALTAELPINSLWTGAGGFCEQENDGDPWVLYDQLADRWLLSQFYRDGANVGECIAISQTADPVTGGWFLYEFALADFPDYPKIGLWPNAYFMGASEGSDATVLAFDRVAMLAGSATSPIAFSASGLLSPHTLLVPASLDGTTPPPDGAPGLFLRHVDDLFDGVDRLEIFELQPDFVTPGNSTFSTIPESLPVAAFDGACDYALNCVEQPVTSQRLDVISEWPMARLVYRNFADHEALVINHTVAGPTTDQAAVRWYELRRSLTLGLSGWSVHQQSTYAPDTTSRWMGSAAMDGDGNLAIAYSVSSDVVSPGLRFAARYASDPIGTLGFAEVTGVEGTGVQTGFLRWGDYSSLVVDPVDDCTFWFTGEYYEVTALSDWRTRIFTFQVPGCGVASDVIFVDDFETGDTSLWTSQTP